MKDVDSKHIGIYFSTIDKVFPPSLVGGGRGRGKHVRLRLKLTHPSFPSRQGLTITHTYAHVTGHV